MPIETPIPTQVQADMTNRFGYHAPKDDATREAHQMVRHMLYDVAVRVAVLTPVCREQSLAITKLEEAMMWANAAIARQGPVTEIP